MLRSAGERAAVNHPVQGSAADMIKKAMVEINQALSGKGKGESEKTSRFTLHALPCQMILQVHDELLFECDPKFVKDIAKMVKEKMENALKLSVPVVVDLKVGSNWGEMKPLKI